MVNKSKLIVGSYVEYADWSILGPNKGIITEIRYSGKLKSYLYKINGEFIEFEYILEIINLTPKRKLLY